MVFFSARFGTYGIAGEARMVPMQTIGIGLPSARAQMFAFHEASVPD
jgi:hypothetical protein